MKRMRRLLNLVRSLNGEFSRGLGEPFMVALGDEIQGMLKDLSRVPNAIRIHEVSTPERSLSAWASGPRRCGCLSV